MCADIKYPRVWLQVCVGISGSEFIWMCVFVSTSTYIHVHKCVCVCFIQHLKDLRQKRVGTSGISRFISRPQWMSGWPNATRAQRESSATCSPPYITVPVRSIVWKTWENQFCSSPAELIQQNIYPSLNAVLNTMDKTLRMVALKIICKCKKT